MLDASHQLEIAKKEAAKSRDSIQQLDEARAQRAKVYPETHFFLPHLFPIQFPCISVFRLCCLDFLFSSCNALIYLGGSSTSPTRRQNGRNSPPPPLKILLLLTTFHKYQLLPQSLVNLILFYLFLFCSGAGRLVGDNWTSYNTLVGTDRWVERIYLVWGKFGGCCMFQGMLYVGRGWGGSCEMDDFSVYVIWL
jgi:hypothetical protein